MSHRYSPYDLKKRLFAFSFAVTFLFLCLLIRLFFVQVIQGEGLQIKAAEQWTRDLPVTASRGKIVDRNGVILAANYTAYTVYVRPREVGSKEGVAPKLSAILGVPSSQILEKIQKNVSEVTVYKKATKEQANSITALDEDGIYLSTDIQRIYPYGDMLSQIIGYISSDNEGQAGLERYYDKYLQGIDGYVLSESDLTGNRLDGTSQYYVPAIEGLNIKLTIDYGIQKIAENAMEFAMLTYNPKGARAIVMNPNTGEILAMANKPGFDLNDVPRDDINTLNELSRNSLVVDIYEPGSTFKIFTVSANMEEYSKGSNNAFSPSYIFPNGRTRVVDGRTIKCWSNHANGKHANQNIAKALNNSCNPVFVDIALKLGKETFYNYLEAFNFGKVTGIDFPGEGSGMVIPEESAKNGDLARMGFGQSIAVSPIQLAAGACAIVNGGSYMQPYLVSEIYSSKGITAEKIYPEKVRQAISAGTSRQLIEMMEDVVKNGSGKNAYIEGYRVGGKTGTAQKFENGVIAQGKYVSSFIGFFPADNPQYLALVIVDEPEGANYGSVVAAPYAKYIFEQIISYKNLKPSAG